MVFQRAAIFVLLCALVGASVSAEELGAAAAPSTAGHRVTGVLVSETGRSAIVNGKLTQEGDRVDGAQVLAIVVGAVRLRRGSQEATVFVGSNAAWEASSSLVANVADASSRKLPIETQVPPASFAASEARMVDTANADAPYGPVHAGETLSEIAEHYLRDEVTMNQMMIGLFEANPKAFRGNINVLYAGATLRIPEINELRRQAPAAAAAQVARHRVAWANAAEPQLALTHHAPSHETYGPVARGETLSGVSESILREGVTRHQLMIALFEANPQAFSGNINALLAGAILRIPDVEAVRHQPPATAAVEVLRQKDSWLIAKAKGDILLFDSDSAG